jgi:tRNA threonylcarbamoyladenosine biosynthesis protein TsaE
MLEKKWEFHLDEIGQIAREWWGLTWGSRVFAFHGSMGAGKTTFIRTLCQEKGVTDPIGSPTFSLVNEYAFSEDGKSGKIFHLDLYRIANEEEALRAGIEECLWSGAWCFVEWPEKSPMIFPPGTIHAYLTEEGDGRRKLILRSDADNQ